MDNSITRIPVAMIEAGDNDRKRFDQEELEALAASIQRHGLAQPITVRPKGPVYQIVAGERRFRAMSKILGWSEVPAIVRSLDDRQAEAIMLAENTGRVDLRPMEEARAYSKRLAESEIPELASAAGVTEDRVRRRLALLKVAGHLQPYVDSGDLPIGHAEALATWPEEVQASGWRVFVKAKHGLSLSHFKRVLSDLGTANETGGLFAAEEEWLKNAEEIDDVMRGKRARVGVPIRSDLPEIPFTPRNTAAGVIRRFIRDLEAAGLHDEAAVVGTLYSRLVELNYMKAAQ